MTRRVAITGLGVVTPAGNDVPAMWSRLLEGRGCGAPITNFDARGFSTRIAAEVRNADTLPLPPDRKLLKFGNRSHRFALVAAEEAMRDAGIAPTPADRHRWGCVVGTGMMTVSFDELASVQREAAPEPVNSMRARSSPRRLPTTRWRSAAASRPPACRC